MLSMLSDIHHKFILDDIFIHRMLQKSKSKSDTKDEVIVEVRSEKLMEYPRVLLHGDSLSGKTSLAFWMFREYIKKGMIPVYIEVNQSAKLSGDVHNQIYKNLLAQYDSSDGIKIDTTRIDPSKIVPIIDNFYLADRQSEHIDELARDYKHSVLIYNDTFIAELKNYKLKDSYDIFEPQILLPSERRALIRAFIKTCNKHRLENKFLFGDNYSHDVEDEYVDKVDTIIGRTIAGFIISAYPVYILSLLLNEAMVVSSSSSQFATLRHYYQSLLQSSFIKFSIAPEDINLYWNFLREMAFMMYERNIQEMNETEYQSFLTSYDKKFELYIDQSDIINKLIEANVVDRSEDRLKFKAPYIRYFFVAEYISYHMDGDDDLDKMNNIVESLVDNIGAQENAFILIFLAHSDKKNKQDLIKKITRLLDNCFSEYDAAQLTKNEIDDEMDRLVNQAVPIAPFNVSSNNRINRVEESRAKRDKEDDKSEIQRKNRTEDVEESDSHELKEMKISMRAIEVLGHIMKNEFATIEKQEVDKIFEKGINNHLRITAFLFSIIESMERDILGQAEELNDNETRREIKKAISSHYFLMSLFTVIRVTRALGSRRIIKSLNNFCKKEDTPAHFLIGFYADVMYKNGDFDALSVKRKMNDKNFPETCKSIMQHLFRQYWEYNKMSNSMLMKKAAALKIEYNTLFGYKYRKDKES